MDEERRVLEQSRRGFVDWVLSRTLTTWLLSTSFGGLVLAVIYPAGRYLIPPETGESATAAVTLPFGPNDVPSNSGQIFKFGNRAGMLIKTPTGELKAFSATCTHLGCIVQYRDDLSQIWCACHNGHFDLNGRNVQGPPPRPLEEYQVNVREDQIVVTKGD
jgi:Rieske Fe-S protein